MRIPSVSRPDYVLTLPDAARDQRFHVLPIFTRLVGLSEENKVVEPP
jgi:hypothetical protein